MREKLRASLHKHALALTKLQPWGDEMPLSVQQGRDFINSDEIFHIPRVHNHLFKGFERLEYAKMNASAANQDAEKEAIAQSVQAAIDENDLIIEELQPNILGPDDMTNLVMDIELDSEELNPSKDEFKKYDDRDIDEAMPTITTSSPTRTLLGTERIPSFRPTMAQVNISQ